MSEPRHPRDLPLRGRELGLRLRTAESLAILVEKKRIVLPEPRVWPEAIDELESFEYSVSDAGNVKTSAPPGVHDDIVMALALATFMPGRFDPDVKPNPRALLSMLGRPPKPRRARFRVW